MAVEPNAFRTFDAVGNREVLSDVVSRISPEDTPIYSMIGKTHKESMHPEWNTDELDPPAYNAHPQAHKHSFDDSKPVRRLRNYTQIFVRTWVVSNSQQAVSNAGGAEQIKTFKLKAGIGIRKDIEWSIVHNTASREEKSDTEPAHSGSLATFYEKNVTRGPMGANGGFDDTTKQTVSPKEGEVRPFTKELLDSTMQQVYISGGTLKYAVCSPYVKSVFTSFMSNPNVAQFRYAATSNKNSIIATADVYEGDFGKVMIVPNRVMSLDATKANNVHLIDPDLLEMVMLRKIQSEKNLANVADAKFGKIIGEGTLCVKNEQGLGLIADVMGTTPPL